MIRLKRGKETLARLNADLVWLSTNETLAELLNEATEPLLPVHPAEGDPGLFIANQLVSRLEIPAKVVDSRKKIISRIF